MSIEELVARLRALDVQLIQCGENPHYWTPRGSLDPELAAAIEAQWHALVPIMGALQATTDESPPPPPPAAPPPAFAAIVKRVRERDAAYFRDHPAQERYRRLYVPGEAWPYSFPQDTRVEVVRIAETSRVRDFLWLHPIDRDDG